MSSARTCGGSGWGGLPGGYEIHLKGTLPGWGSSGCRTAIDRQIHRVLTGWGGGWRVGSGWDRRGRSSRTFPECGSVVTTAVTAMGGARSDNRMGLAYCSRSWGRLDSGICEPRGYDEAHKWGTWGGWRGIVDGHVRISSSSYTGRFWRRRRQVRPCVSERG